MHESEVLAAGRFVLEALAVIANTNTDDDTKKRKAEDQYIEDDGSEGDNEEDQVSARE